jgi:hypothetical protein
MVMQDRISILSRALQDFRSQQDGFRASVLEQALGAVIPVLKKNRSDVSPRLQGIPHLAHEWRSKQADMRAHARAKLETSLGHITPWLNDSYVSTRASPESFNLFDVLSVSRREYAHSNVVAWLLEPLGSHGLGTAFVDKIFQECSLPPHRGANRMQGEP